MNYRSATEEIKRRMEGRTNGVDGCKQKKRSGQIGLVDGCKDLRMDVRVDG